jgi:hypothetical protein
LNRNDPDIAALWVRVEQAVRAIQGRAIQGPPLAAGDGAARLTIGDTSPP